VADSYAHPIHRLLRLPWLTRLGTATMLLVFAFLVAAALLPIGVGPFVNEGGLRWGRFGVEPFDNNLLVFVLWIMWLPLVSLSTALMGRFWCGNLCPMGLVTDGARSLAERWLGKGTGIKPYLRLGWLLPTGFILITFYARSFPVQEKAWLGALTFVGLFVIAMGVGFFLRRGAWCRYFCPIGGWLARIARLSPLTLRPQPAVCEGCVEKPCISGTQQARSCPAYLNPSRLDSNRYCLECWHCVRNCPERLASLRLGLRPPGAELLKPHSPDIWETVYIAGLVGLYTALIAAPRYFPQIPFAAAFFGSVVVAMAAYAGLGALASFLGGIGWREAVTKLGYIFLPMEFAMAMITFGDEAWNFFGITVPVVAILLGLGFMGSSVLAVSILRNSIPAVGRALRVGVPIAIALTAMLFLWSQWFLAGVVIDVT
ncbi:MAG: 4Fe-4S binding protein, partial [Chloroflexota bacterium]